MVAHVRGTATPESSAEAFCPAEYRAPQCGEAPGERCRHVAVPPSMHPDSVRACFPGRISGGDAGRPGYGATAHPSGSRAGARREAPGYQLPGATGK